jgi:hypothetical protein
MSSQMQPAPELPLPFSSFAAVDGKICGRWATLTGALGSGTAAPVSYVEGASYDGVQLGPGTKAVEHNSVLLIPGLLSEEECAQMIEDVEMYGVAGAKAGGGGLERHRVLAEPRLSAGTAALFEELLRERLLPLISSEMPSVVEYLWACSVASVHDLSIVPTQPRAPGVALKALPYRCVSGWSTKLHTGVMVPVCGLSLCRFAVAEPAINRYSEGGEFGAHTDQQALTLNILLRTGCFEGGGTAFWAQTTPKATATNSTDTQQPVMVERLPTLCLQPTAAGTVS